MFAFLKTRRTPDTVAPEPPPPDPNASIDVKQLIARYAGSEHAARADAYFAGLSDDDKLLRKPFFGIADTQSNMHGIAEMLQLLRLFPGARVLDFGAGTGWFSRMLAFLDCRPIALDISAKALELGRTAFSRDPAAAGLSIDWLAFDGVALPLPDGSVDRIVCYDSFHHVADQAATLREFHRVLADGGRIAFHEPGPGHSKIPQSQIEMRLHEVIENDIVIEDIWAAAGAIGFANLQLALTAPLTLAVSLERYTRIIAGDASVRDASAVLRTIVGGAENLRIFSMTKGDDSLDSRTTAGLGGSFEVTLTDTSTDKLHGRFRATNTGSARWLPSTGAVGSVAIGVRQSGDIAGTGYAFGRIRLSDHPVLPGDTVQGEFSLQATPERPLTLTLDLVAEEVTWFELIGGTPLTIHIV